jgi:hypothetical protein
MKTFEDYYNDPAIADEPRALREIHAIRFQLRDEAKNMTVDEYHDALWRDALEGSRRYGIRLTTTPSTTSDK